MEPHAPSDTTHPHPPAGQFDDAWLAWAAAADDADEIELATHLLATVPPELDSREVCVERARLHLLGGRPQAALAELARHGWHDVPADGPHTWAEAVLAAARAATGDARCFHHLLESASRAAGQPGGWRAAYLVAAAAEAIGQQDIADEAWRSLVIRYGIATPLTVEHLASATVARRDTQDATAVLATVLAQARNFSDITPSPTEDPWPVLTAAANLRVRGDDAGARLLLSAVTRLGSGHPQIAGALATVTPEREMRRHHAVVVAVSTLGMVALFLGMPGVMAFWFAQWLWTRYVRIPGLTRTESHAWRALRSLHYDTAVGAVRSTSQSSSGWYGLAGIIGFGIGLFVGNAASKAAAAILGHDIRMVSISMWLVGVVGLPALAVVTTRALHRYALARARLRQEAARERARLAGAARCQCWQTSQLTGAFAEAYRTAHLVPAGDQATFERLAARIGRPVQVGRCPITGVVWLVGSLTRGGSPMLLRGTVPPMPPGTEPTGQAATGFYL